MTTKQRARVILIDEQKRVLLILVNDRQPKHIEYPNHVQFWITPGGGAEPGETPEVTAIRELAEETGIQITSVGGPIWTFSRKLRFPNGDLVTFEEVFFVVHVHSPIIQTEQMDESEHYSNIEYRWWTLHDLQKSDELFMPPWLPQRLATLP